MARQRHRECGSSWAVSALSTALFIAAVTGCGDSGPLLLPVKGKVTIDGKPATEGGVIFKDVNKPTVQFAGAIEPDGTYSMIYGRRHGAPLGKYRVAVIVTDTKKRPDGQPTGLPKTLSNAKFSNPDRSPLEVEVKEGAGPESFDLAVTK